MKGSRRVLSCHAVSYRVLCYLVMSRLVVSCRVTSCHVLQRIVVSCLALSFLVKSVLTTFPLQCFVHKTKVSAEAADRALREAGGDLEHALRILVH
jgi:hypothetical protein